MRHSSGLRAAFYCDCQVAGGKPNVFNSHSLDENQFIRLIPKKFTTIEAACRNYTDMLTGVGLPNGAMPV